MDVIVNGSHPLRDSKHNAIRACPQENVPFKSDVNSSSELFYYQSQVYLSPVVCKTPLREAPLNLASPLFGHFDGT